MTIPVIIKKFVVGDVEDPDSHAAIAMHQWQQTEEGDWMMKYSSPRPTVHQMIDIESYGVRYVIKGYLTPENYTYWKLRYE